MQSWEDASDKESELQVERKSENERLQNIFLETPIYRDDYSLLFTEMSVLSKALKYPSWWLRNQ